jgi:Ca2+-binding EF-hand superfamily protein
MNMIAPALAVIAGTLALPTAALAFEPYLPKASKVFAKVDADSDGKISLEEIRPLAEKRFLKFDGDNDGAVSAAEIDVTLQKAIENRRNRILKSMDANADGGVTKAELDAFVANLIAAADADRDGGLTLEEIRNNRVAKLRKPATGDNAN